MADFGYRKQMLRMNFSWSSSIYLRVEDRELDMHNHYNFVGLSYDVQTRTVVLSWRRATGAWVDRDIPDQVSITLTGIHHFHFKPRDAALPFSEDDCLASFGYDCDDQGADGQFWTDAPPDPSWRWSFEFQSGAEIVLRGERAVAKVLFAPNGDNTA